jgi:hypothetical protein
MIIFAHFPEAHSFSFESGMIFARKKMRGDLLADDLQFFYSFYYVGGS